MSATTTHREIGNKNANHRLSVLIKRKPGVPFVEGLRKADEKNMRIPSLQKINQVAGRMSFEGYDDLESAFPCWTGTFVAFKGPHKSLSDSVIYTDQETGQRYVFPVPKYHQSMSDVILVVEHPNYSLEKDGKDLIVAADSDKIELVSKFPSKNGWYKVDQWCGIPTTEEANPLVDYVNAFGLNRFAEEGVGPVALSFDYLPVATINFGLSPSTALGMTVEAPAEKSE